MNILLGKKEAASAPETASAPKPETAFAPKKEGAHNLALDGLRWWAFLGVFLYHAYETTFWFGRFGVQIFFVLSGFLIGRILLQMRENDAVSVGERLRTFYARRALRIFPLYYFALLMILVLGLLHILKEPRFYVLPYHALYLTNFFLFFTPAQIDSQTHFWTLCVEEHFYLLAPFVLLLAPLRTIRSGLVVLFALNLVLRLLNSVFWHLPRFEYLSPIEFDVLSFGIAAALLEREGQFLGVDYPRLARIGGVCGALALGVFIWYSARPEGLGREIVVDGLLPTLLALAASAGILALWKGRTPRWLTSVFAAPPLVFLGQISYGLYVYHNFSFVVMRHSLFVSNRALGVLAALGATITIACLSWFFLEKPLNDLKRFFPQTKPARS